MSKKVELLLDEPCPELLCGICLDVLDDPIQVHCPEDHMFCSKCIHHHMNNNISTCPLCLTMLDKNSFQSSKFVSRQVGRLRIKCLYFNHGCSWQGLISDNHIAECTYKPMICPNAENGCTVTDLNSNTITQHLSECLYQYTTCPNNMPLCQPYLRQDESIHQDTCCSYTCPFSTEGCPYMGTYNAMTVHCDGYCGRLHQKIDDLESEVKRLNSLIHDFTIGLNIKLPSIPSTTIEQQKQQQDTCMDSEMALFHEMFNSDPFGALDLNGDINKSTIETTTKDTKSMDILSSTDLNNFLDNNNKTSLAIFNEATSPQPLQFIPPMTVPKRTSNGKKIRYSKNVRLAHSAIRIARQRTASSSSTSVNPHNVNPTNDAILNNLDMAKKQRLQQQQQQQQQSITFKNLDDVTQFLSNTTTTTTITEEEEGNKILSSQQQEQQEEKRQISAPSPPTNMSSPTSSSSSSSSSNNNNGLPKRRPMFILASSYLSNYNSANSPPPPPPPPPPLL